MFFSEFISVCWVIILLNRGEFFEPVSEDDLDLNAAGRSILTRVGDYLGAEQAERAKHVRPSMRSPAPRPSEPGPTGAGGQTQ